MSYSDLHL